MLSPDDQGTPNWRAYLFFCLVTAAGSIFGGCVNRQFAKPGNEQILGKLDEINAKLVKLNPQHNRK